MSDLAARSIGPVRLTQSGGTSQTLEQSPCSAMGRSRWLWTDGCQCSFDDGHEQASTSKREAPKKIPQTRWR